MLAEIVRPVTFILCILSLFGTFHAAFLVPAIEVDQRIFESLRWLGLAAGLALTSGLVFREAGLQPDKRSSSLFKSGLTALLRTFPVRMFCWASVAMLILFVASWYLENHCVLYRDNRLWV